MSRSYAADVAAGVADAEAGLAPVGEHPGDPVGLMELTVETNDSVAGHVTAAYPFPAAVSRSALHFPPERQNAVEDLPSGPHGPAGTVMCMTKASSSPAAGPSLTVPRVLPATTTPTDVRPTANALSSSAVPN